MTGASIESATGSGILPRIGTSTATSKAIARRIGLGVALLSCGCPLGPSVEPDPTPPIGAPGPPDDARPPEPEPSAPPVPRDPPRVLTDPGSGVTVVWAGAAAQAVVAGPDLVVLEPGGAHLGAQRWSDGEARWRIEVSASESARLHALGDRVVLHDGDRATVIEAARGRTLSRTAAPIDESAALAYELRQHRGACAWVAPCGIQAVDCDDGSPRGDVLRSVPSEAAATDGSAQACRTTPALLGRHAQTLVLLAEHPPPSTEPATEPATAALWGLDATTGTPRWIHPLPSPTDAFGMTDDGGCWYLDRQAPRVHVLACDDGSPRWDRPIGPGAIEVYAAAQVLILAREHGGRWRLSAHATADGSPRWGIRLGRRQRPLLPDEPIVDAEPGNRRVYALIDPTEGAVRGELVAGRDERLWRDPGGGFVLIGRELRELDASGHLTRQRPFPATKVHTVTAGHVLGQVGEAIEIYDRDQLRERARVEGRMQIEADAGLPGDRLLLRRPGDDGVALVLGLGAPTRGGPRRP